MGNRAVTISRLIEHIVGPPCFATTAGDGKFSYYILVRIWTAYEKNVSRPLETREFYLYKFL